MTKSNVQVALLPVSAVELLKTYDKAEHPWYLVSVPSARSTAVDLKLVQDGSEEPVVLSLLVDGTWTLAAQTAVPGVPEES